MKGFAARSHWMQAHLHLGGMVMADHELQDAAGHMQESSGPAAPQHLQLNARPDTHRHKTVPQMQLGGQTDDPDTLTFLSGAEWHDVTEKCTSPFNCADGLELTHRSLPTS
jgi:hypothetical protein